MAESLPSKRFAITDVPEVTNFKSNFDYNFFVPDEKENDSGLNAPAFIRRRPAGTFDNTFIDSINFQRFVPRFVRFSWKPTVDEERSKFRNNLNIESISIANNIDKIHNEQTFTTDDFTNTYFQDTDAERKLDFFIKRLLQEARERQEAEEDESPLDIVKFLLERYKSRVVGSQIDPQFLTEVFINMTKEGYRFLDKNREQRTIEKIIQEVSKVRVRTQLNNKVINTLLKTTSENTLNIFNNESARLLKEAKQIQEEAIGSKNSSLIDGRDYDFEILEYLDFKKVDPNAFDATVQVIGYIIDKWELNEQGALIEKDPIIVENPRANSAIDLKIKYGARYAYSIRSVAFVELQVEDSETNSVVALSFLISSLPSERTTVLTEEFVPPRPPADFNVDWCYSNEAARLMWNFPVNTQRDIKHFQVFRRSSIAEPFQLIKMYSFDNSTIRTPLNETPDPFLVENRTSPKNIFIDEEFTKDTKFIYAVACLDAHGFSSNYSTQFQVSFNRFTNRLEKKVISLSGAPKAYPNAFLQQDTFVDTIKTSGHSKVKVVFNPEFLKLIDSQGNDLQLVRTDNGAEYRLQMINVDIQQQQNVKIKLEDKRTTSEKENT